MKREIYTKRTLAYFLAILGSVFIMFIFWTFQYNYMMNLKLKINLYLVPMIQAICIAILLIFLFELHQKVLRLAHYDPLTGLLNRRKFLTQLDMWIELAKRYNRHFSLSIIDIDHFKKINDTHGHNKGDLILKEFSNFLSKRTRKSDFVCRWGGEEFMILMPETTLKEAVIPIQAVREGISRLTTLPEMITISAGIAQYKNAEKAQTLIHRADQALYRAKKAGRNQVITDPS